MNFSEDDESTGVTIKKSGDKKPSQTKFKVWETLCLEPYTSILYDNSLDTSKSAPNSYFCLLKDYLLNSCDPEIMINNFNKLLKSSPAQSLVYWLEQLNIIFFSNFLIGVNARWSSFNEYLFYIIY
jgi:hypothetical protein